MSTWLAIEPPCFAASAFGGRSTDSGEFAGCAAHAATAAPAIAEKREYAWSFIDLLHPRRRFEKTRRRFERTTGSWGEREYALVRAIRRRAPRLKSRSSNGHPGSRRPDSGRGAARRCRRSERAEEGDQRGLLFGGQVEAELVARDGARRLKGTSLAGRHVVLAKTEHVEPVLERRDGAGVLEQVAIPETAQRRDLVVAGPLASLEREARIGADPALGDVEALRVGVV